MKCCVLTRLLIVAVLLCAFSDSLPGQEPQVIRLICLPGVPLPVVIANRNGIFAKYGVAVQAEKAKDAAALRTALMNGTADFAHSSVENAVVMSDVANADVSIVIGGEQATSELIVQPDVKRVEDLRGRTIILDGPDTAYTLTIKKILRSHGLNPEKDCQFKVIGLAPDRLAAMKENKEYAATIQKPPTSILSKQAGLASLGSTQELTGSKESQGIGGFAMKPWTQNHPELLTRYLAAFIEAQRWLMAPENKQQVIELLAKESHLAPDIAAETYAIDIERGWSKDAKFNAQGFKDGLALQAELENSSASKPHDAANYYDLSYYQRALALLGARK